MSGPDLVRVVEDSTGDSWDLPPARAAEVAALLAEVPRVQRPTPTREGQRHRQVRDGSRKVAKSGAPPNRCDRCGESGPLVRHVRADMTEGWAHPACHTKLHRGHPSPIALCGRAR